MEKRTNKYKLIIEKIESVNPEIEKEPAMTLQIENHDDIFNIIKTLQRKQIFSNDSQAAEFGIGIKLFSEVMIRNRANPIFENFFPAFKDFMVVLKK